ncbi:DMT family transporter [Rhodovulum sulfidophilum]|uniref:EamA family transporter n=1 Tax=Rhodovulum sulfidophilum TaxID=35806 RepID=UPI001920DAD3|nr:DMT family transporter [Rhodovulum sulfidophilum]
MICFRSSSRQAPGLFPGIGAISAAVLMLSLSDALVKLQNGGLSLGQVLMVRSGTAVLCLVGTLWLFAQAGGAASGVTRWVWARSLCLALMWVCYYAGLPGLSFSIAEACYYTAPIWMAVLSFLLLGTRIGARGGLAILLGFAGVLTILRPGLDALSPVIALPLLAGFLYALAAVITQGRCRDVPPVSMALNLNLVLFLAGAAHLAVLLWLEAGDEAGFLLSVWPGLGMRGWAFLIGLGVALAVITALVAFAYQRAPVPVIGLFDNGYLVFALVWSVLLFGERPDLVDLLGIVLIGCGALLASRRLSGGEEGGGEDARAPRAQPRRV